MMNILECASWILPTTQMHAVVQSSSADYQPPSTVLLLCKSSMSVSSKHF